MATHPDWAKPGMTVTVERHHPILGLEHSRTAVVDRWTPTRVVLNDGRYFKENHAGTYWSPRSPYENASLKISPAEQPAPEVKEERDSGEIQVSSNAAAANAHLQRLLKGVDRG